MNGAERDRTVGLDNANVALSQLSYSPVYHGRSIALSFIAGNTGVVGHCCGGNSGSYADRGAVGAVSLQVKIRAKFSAVFCRCKYQGYQDFLKPNKKKTAKK